MFFAVFIRVVVCGKLNAGIHFKPVTIIFQQIKLLILYSRGTNYNMLKNIISKKTNH